MISAFSECDAGIDKAIRLPAESDSSIIPTAIADRIDPLNGC
jgi:hypothetical protein